MKRERLRIEIAAPSEGPVFGLFLAVATFSLFAYGIDVDRFLTYNLFYSDVFRAPGKYLGTPLEIVAQDQVLRIFSQTFSPILLSPILNGLSAIGVFVLIMWIGFITLSLHYSPRDSLLVVLVIGIVSHGFFPGLDGSAMVFDRKAIVVALMIAAIHFLVLGNYWVFCITAVGGVLLHPLNAIAGLGFILPGYLLYTMFHERDRVRPLIGTLAILTMFIVFRGGGAIGVDESGAKPIAEWYRLILAMEVGDAALFDYLGNSVGVIGFVLLLAGMLAWSDLGSGKLLNYWCVTFIPITCLMLLFEAMNYWGITLGIFSEAFITIQFRRGFWLVCLLCLVKVILFFLMRFSEKKLWSQIDMAVLIGTVFVHSVPVMMFSTLYYFFRRSDIFGRGGGVCTVIISGLLGIQLTLQINQLDLTRELLKVVVFLGFVSIFFVLARRSLTKAFAIVSIVFSSLVLANNNVRHDIFRQSWEHVNAGRPGESDQSLKVASFGASEELKDYFDVVLVLNRTQAKSTESVLLASPELGYAAPIVSKHRYLFSRWDNSLMFSRKLMSKYLAKLEDFDVNWQLCGSGEQVGTACFLVQIQNRIDGLSEEELQKLSEKYHVRYVVRKEALDQESFYENDRLRVYQLMVDGK